MKVAIIGHKQIPGRSGGVEVVVEELASRLAHRGVEVVATTVRLKVIQVPLILTAYTSRTYSPPTIRNLTLLSTAIWPPFGLSLPVQT